MEIHLLLFDCTGDKIEADGKYGVLCEEETLLGWNRALLTYACHETIGKCSLIIIILTTTLACLLMALLNAAVSPLLLHFNHTDGKLLVNSGEINK